MDPRQVVRAVTVVAVVALSAITRAPAAPSTGLSASARPQLSQAQVDAGLTFGPGAGPFDRQLIEGAIVDAQPAARALIERIDGITRIDVGPTPAGASGSCAPRAERFAETFAKWATHDIGVNLYLGYAVPPPGDLDAWAAPLTRLPAL